LIMVSHDTSLSAQFDQVIDLDVLNQARGDDLSFAEN